MGEDAADRSHRRRAQAYQRAQSAEQHAGELAQRRRALNVRIWERRGSAAEQVRAAQVWRFTIHFAVPFTNNACEEAQRMVGANAPGIQRILNEALQAADWFGSAHQAAVLEAAGKPGVDDRMTAVRTLIAEETTVSMLIGVAVGYELAHQLMQREE